MAQSAQQAIYIKLAQKQDLPTIMNFIEDGRKQLANNGIPQWNNGYPSNLTMQQDIEAGNCYMLMVGDQPAGCATLMLQGDTYYTHIVSGKWKQPGHPFATIHRVAVSDKFRGMRLSSYLFSAIISIAYEKGARNFRVSTHEKNKAMQALLAKFGFTEQGTVYTGPNPTDLRNAFELNLD